MQFKTRLTWGIIAIIAVFTDRNSRLRLQTPLNSQLLDLFGSAILLPLLKATIIVELDWSVEQLLQSSGKNASLGTLHVSTRIHDTLLLGQNPLDHFGDISLIIVGAFGHLAMNTLDELLGDPDVGKVADLLGIGIAATEVLEMHSLSHETEEGVLLLGDQ
jgi:hypothetical protein